MTTDPFTAAVWYGTFLFSTVCHEAAHATVALRLGDPTAYRGGQVTLSPIPHIRREPLGTVVVPLFTLFAGGGLIGWASAPFDPAWAREHPRRAAIMALAGPLTNLALLLVAGLCLRTGKALGWFGIPSAVASSALAVAPDGWLTVAVTVLSVAFSLNLTLACLNLFPVPPLDGGAALPLFMTDAAGRRYQDWLRSSPGLALLGMYLVWQAFGPIQHALFLSALQILWYPRGAFH